jgi:hypothetical protein
MMEDVVEVDRTRAFLDRLAERRLPWKEHALVSTA